MNVRASFVIGVIVASCSPEVPANDTVTTTTTVVTTSGPVGAYTEGGDGSATITLEGVRIEIAADLPDRGETFTVTTGSGNQTVIALRGWPIRITADRVHVADRDFGPVAAGDTVVVAKDGVHVGTELRGPLP